MKRSFFVLVSAALPPGDLSAFLKWIIIAHKAPSDLFTTRSALDDSPAAGRSHLMLASSTFAPLSHFKKRSKQAVSSIICCSICQSRSNHLGSYSDLSIWFSLLRIAPVSLSFLSSAHMVATALRNTSGRFLSCTSDFMRRLVSHAEP